MNGIFDKMHANGSIPVVNINSIETGINLAQAILNGGLTVIEVTFRTELAPEAINKINREFPDIMVGAGTVLTCEQALIAKESKARFIVSPGYDEELVYYCKKIGMPVIPGVNNASDIQRGLKANLSVLKFFPAEINGDVKAINTLAAPFSQIKFLPAGGIEFHSIEKYLSNSHVIACMGTYMARASQIENREWDIITKQCKKAVDIVKKIREKGRESQ